MKPVSRSPVHKKSSAKKFSRHTRKTAGANLPHTPMRGGWRF